MIELRRQIECVVRPIRASQWRKDRMREELLAHLSALYDEELAASTGDEAAALAAAKARFGAPATLSSELQSTVPVVERWAFMNLPGSKLHMLIARPGETQAQLVRRRLKLMAWATAANAALWLVFLAAVLFGLAKRPRPFDPVRFTTLVLSYITVFPVFVAGLPILCDQIQRDWRRLREATGASRRRILLRIAGCSALSGSLFPVVMVGLMFLLEWNLRAPLFPNTGYWVVFAVLAVTGALLTVLTARDARRYEEWGALSIDQAGEDAHPPENTAADHA